MISYEIIDWLKLDWDDRIKSFGTWSTQSDASPYSQPEHLDPDICSEVYHLIAVNTRFTAQEKSQCLERTTGTSSIPATRFREHG